MAIIFLIPTLSKTEDMVFLNTKNLLLLIVFGAYQIYKAILNLIKKVLISNCVLSYDKFFTFSVIKPKFYITYDISNF